MNRNIAQRQIDYFYEDKYLAIVKKIVLKEVDTLDCQVFLFGSRANGKFRSGSDIDIGISGLAGDLFDKIKSRILMQIEESIVPFDVDIIDFDRVDVEFKNESQRNIVIWK